MEEWRGREEELEFSLKKDIWDGIVGFTVLFGFCRFLICPVFSRCKEERYRRLEIERGKGMEVTRKERDEIKQGRGKEK